MRCLIRLLISQLIKQLSGMKFLKEILHVLFFFFFLAPNFFVPDSCSLSGEHNVQNRTASRELEDPVSCR